MKTRTLKILLDVVMLVVYSFLIFGTDFSGIIHEVLGIAISAIFILHIVLNTQICTSMCKSIKTRKASSKIKALLTLDFLLFVFMPMAIIKGLLISEDLLNQRFNNSIFLIHQISSYGGFVILLIHIGVHSAYLLSFFKVENKKAKIVLKAGLSLCIIAILGLGVIEVLDTVSEIINPLDSFNCHLEDENNELDDEIASLPTTEAPQQAETEASIPTLEEYLSQQGCDGCRKSCSLLDPDCSRGEALQQQAIADYHSIYG